MAKKKILIVGGGGFIGKWLLKSFPEVGSYLDVGANDPIRFSNTNLLYKKGWKGVNVEPNLTLFHKLERFRPRDINLNVAVGIGDKKTMFFFSENALSTADDQVAKELVNSGRQLQSKVEVECVSLRYLLDQYFQERRCDLLNIDAEGLDLEIIESMELDSLPIERFPIWILVETKPPVESVQNNEITRLLKEFNYELFLALPRASLFRFKK